MGQILNVRQNKRKIKKYFRENLMLPMIKVSETLDDSEWWKSFTNTSTFSERFCFFIPRNSFFFPQWNFNRFYFRIKALLGTLIVQACIQNILMIKLNAVLTTLVGKESGLTSSICSNNLQWHVVSIRKWLINQNFLTRN